MKNQIILEKIINQALPAKKQSFITVIFSPCRNKNYTHQFKLIEYLIDLN